MLPIKVVEFFANLVFLIRKTQPMNKDQSTNWSQIIVHFSQVWDCSQNRTIISIVWTIRNLKTISVGFFSFCWLIDNLGWPYFSNKRNEWNNISKKHLYYLLKLILLSLFLNISLMLSFLLFILQRNKNNLVIIK